MQTGERVVLVGPAEPQLYGMPAPLQVALEWLGSASNITPLALYIQPDEDTELTRLAASPGILVFEQRVLKTPLGQKWYRAQQPDWLIDLGGGVILPEEVLSATRKGCINIHPGTLPAYGGRNAAQWVIRNGGDRFGACAHWLTPEVNAGDLIHTEEFTVEPDATGLEVIQRSIDLCSRLAVRVLDKIDRGDPLPRTPQDATRRRLYGFEETAGGKLDWHLTAREIYDIVRAADYGPYPSPAYIPEAHVDGEKIRIRKAVTVETEADSSAAPGQVIAAGADGVHVACGEGVVLVLEVEPVAGPRAAQRLAGAAIPDVLGIVEGDILR